MNHMAQEIIRVNPRQRDQGIKSGLIKRFPCVLFVKVVVSGDH